ncbi:MAG: hypothetical protein IJT96_08425 [Lachnospiraceae bacterium]|nr:hypothetical protein [Lachnospiraceae bacterium]
MERLIRNTQNERITSLLEEMRERSRREEKDISNALSERILDIGSAVVIAIISDAITSLIGKDEHSIVFSIIAFIGMSILFFLLYGFYIKNWILRRWKFSVFATERTNEEIATDFNKNIIRKVAEINDELNIASSEFNNDSTCAKLNILVAMCEFSEVIRFLEMEIIGKAKEKNSHLIRSTDTSNTSNFFDKKINPYILTTVIYDSMEIVKKLKCMIDAIKSDFVADERELLLNDFECMKNKVERLCQTDLSNYKYKR